MSKFNDAQEKAIKHHKGPMLVLAGPGSGKTTVITHRTRFLIEQAGVHPANILVITFTKAAAVEMKQRFSKLMATDKTASQVQSVYFGTFHAIFFQILKYAYRYTASNIIREDKKKQIIKAYIEKEQLELEDEVDIVEEIISEISMVKSDMIGLEQFHSSCVSDQAFHRIYSGYVESCQKERLLDFDDMLLYTYELLKARKDILALWQKKFQYILIDEFQDINFVQYEIMKMLALPENNLFIVGDDDQSIYGFRGSKPEIMLGFQKDYPKAKVVILDKNYRSSNEIVTAAKQLITNNKRRYEKKIEAVSEFSEPIHIVEKKTQKEQYEDLVKRIKASNEEGMPYHQMAVLYRTNTQARLLSEKLLEYNIPFVMRDGMFNLYEHWVTKNIIAYVRLANKDYSRANFLTIMNRPLRYISRDVLPDPIVNFDIMRDLYEEQKKRYMCERIDELQSQMIMLRKMTPYAAISYIRQRIGYDDFIHTYCQERNLKEEELFEILDTLQEASKPCQTVQEWFDHMKEYKESLEQMKKLQKEPNQEAVVLATMHSSKGLEFDQVFIIDACEDVTPHKKSLDDESIEEERRMFYVAMTRARKHLYIYVPEHIFNKTMKASRFVRELLIDARTLEVGKQVRHMKYGIGTITYMDEKHITIFFESLQDIRTFHREYCIDQGLLSIQ